MLDVTGSALNEKTGIVSQFTSGGIPAAVVFGREGGNWGTTLGFYTHNDDMATLDQMAERVHVSANGRVGIGTNAPSATLDVAGNVNVSGSISATTVIGAVYQDVAEWVPSGEQLAAGTVVIINPSKKNEVMPSSRAYDTAVAGVVSDKPGVLLGIASDSKSKIATTGRVRVRVDATKHAIAAGDLLVTSEKPGVAMPSEAIDLGGVKIHRPGTLIGKALEPLPSGEGEILVLLSLQ